jgi:hypothetical protein
MNPIGAQVEIEWLSGGTESAYVSFGEYDEDTNEDSHGICDDFIFGYFTIDELNQYKTKPFDGFKVLDFELVHATEEV